MDGKKFSKQSYNSPMDHSGPFVNEVKIGNLYLLDFGDEWESYIDVVKIPERNEGISAMICDRKGEAPEQYNWY